jgi:hypothetical protein
LLVGQVAGVSHTPFYRSDPPLSDRHLVLLR